MLVFSLCSVFLAIVSAERELPSYDFDAGAVPAWIGTDAAAIAKASVERWFIEKTTGTCKPFTYLGSLGNFNNFPSRAACMHHLKFNPEEQVKACALAKPEGKCTVPEAQQIDRWYYNKVAVPADNKLAHTCIKFKYNGCGGNANNFKSELECKNACQNKDNGGMTADEVAAAGKATPVPNVFDCTFVPEVRTDTPAMGIVPHKDGNRCVYAAIGKDVSRGHFKDLPTCVKTCIPAKNQVAACKANGPHQIQPDTKITEMSAVTTYYYFDKTQSLCLPFLAKTSSAATDPKVDDGVLNIFSSAEMCASFCPATAHVGPLTAVKACELPKKGVAAAGAKYEIPRYYYTHSTKECASYNFNGLEMNLNNFKDNTDCEAICKTPLGSA